MDVRRSHQDHIALFVAFGAAVARLTPDAWARIRERCRDLDQPAFQSLLRRASLAARPFEMFLPAGAESRLPFRMIAGASRAVQASLAIAGELVAEFERPGTTGALLRRRTNTTGNPHTDAYIGAYFVIESALEPFKVEHPGVATAVRSAGTAMLRHDWLPPPTFDAVYRYVEPEIPFASLQPPPASA